MKFFNFQLNRNLIIYLIFQKIFIITALITLLKSWLFLFLTFFNFLRNLTIAHYYKNYTNLLQFTIIITDIIIIVFYIQLFRN